MLRSLIFHDVELPRHIQLPLAAQFGRSVRRIEFDHGPNGGGKSNAYRALRLLADTANGGVVGSLARESGISSTLFAGPATQRKEPVALRLGFRGNEFPGSFLVVHGYLTAVKLCAIVFSFGNLKNLCDPRFGICPYSKFHTPRSR